MVTSEAGWHGRSRGWAVKLDSKPSPIVVLSELSGLSVEDVRASRADGTSLADIGEANGVTKDAYVAELVSRATAAIDAMVEAGRLSEERAQAMKDGLADRVESIVTNTDEPGRGKGWGPQLRPRQRRQARRMPLLQIDTGGSQCEPAGSVASPRRTVVREPVGGRLPPP